MNEVSRETTEQLPIRRSELVGRAHADDRVRARARVHAALFGEDEVQEFGRYQLLEAVGHGGMGTVWRARDSKLGREVAIKLLHDGALRRPGPARRQLLAEAALMAKLDHPNVVRVYDVGEHEGELFVAMELVRGKTLRAWQADRAERRGGWREILDVYRAAGAGLVAAHRTNLVHGDFKPDNVLIGDDGRVLVTDFAMTRHVLEARIELELEGTNADTPAGDSSTDSQTRMTTTSGQVPLVKGTPAYMAPEQFDGEIADARTDQFGFCVALWEALAGERPFRGRTWKQLREAIDRGPKTQGSRPGPRALWAALERGLKVDPKERWPSLETLLERLRWIQGRARRWSLAGLGGALASLGFAAAIPALQREPEPVADPIVQQCDPAEAADELATIWSSDRRSAIETAFVATGLPYAQPSADNTLAGLDAWADAWTKARANACTSPDAEAARLSLVCLDRNRASFAELVSVLGQADATTVDMAGELLELLPAVEACADFELPVDERARPSSELAKLSELEGRVDRIELLWMVARTDEALALAEPVLREAEALDAKGIIADVHNLRGLLRLDTGEHELAVDELLRGALMAREAGRTRLEAESWMNIADAESRIGGSHAGRWLDIAALPVELADIPELRFDLANHRGLVARAEGRPAEAAQWHEKALEHLNATREIRPFRRLKGLANLGAALATLDQLDRANEMISEALVLAEQHWPAGHPELGILYNSRANVQRMRGNLQPAQDDFRRAYDLLSTNFGVEHIYSRTVTYQMALIEADLGRCDEARKMLDELIAAIRDDPSAAALLPNTLVWRAMLCNQTQPDSRALADEALERATAVHPEGSLALAQVMAHRAWVLLALEDYAGAEQGFLAARTALEAQLPEGHFDRLALLGGLGVALAGLGRDDEARPLLEQGIAGLGERRPTRTAQMQKALDGLSPAN
jgi:serine/threonine protein kinase/tetratricopeptide (TPR) repeat protein